MDKHLYVVYATDDRFAEILGTSLTSLYKNNKRMEYITVYILEEGVSKENQKKIESISKLYGRQKVQWINVGSLYSKLQKKVSVDRGSLSQYARLFIDSYLPFDLERVLYLDCDTIVKQPLDELWNLDMHGKTIAALMDAFSKWYRKNIDLKSSDIMFNSGVMLVNLKQWREHEIEKKLVNFIQRKGGKVQQGDQGVLNAILSRETYCIKPEFNSLTIFYDFSYKEMMIYRKPPKYYSEELVREAVDNPVIIHYTTSFISLRPWVQGCQYKYAAEWLSYKAISPWRNLPLKEHKSSISFKILYLLASYKGSRRVLIWMCGLLQAYGRPFVNSLILKLKS